MYITESYVLPATIKTALQSRTPQFGFGGFGETIYYRTYSRLRPDGRQEQWADTVCRVVEGVLSIRKTHLLRSGLSWRDRDWDAMAFKLGDAMSAMRFLPPGRGLWVMGTPYLSQRGSMALYNCAATSVTLLSRDAGWLMDCSMCGVGVGFAATPVGLRLSRPIATAEERVVIPDSREGWVESVERLIASYESPSPTVTFDYSLVREAGLPIRGFGGTSSGPGPLKKLHTRLRSYLDAFVDGTMDETELIANVMNAIGACVVAGNVRRSAEIALGSVHDATFINLKNPALFPDRQDIAWMSNNSVVLEHHDDFLALPDIADRIRENGEPGILNLVNVQNFGRLFRPSHDAATLVNPCGEIPLENKEVCNLVEVFPTRCGSTEELMEALELATFYASTVSLLPTHRSETNAVVARNRRIGVSLSGIADWTETTSMAQVTRLLRDAYRVVQDTNTRLAREAGVPASVRLTTVKPSGTVSLLAGVSAGMHWPTFRHAIRRVRVGEGSPIVPTLTAAGVPHEPDAYSDHTLVFSFPIDQGKTRSAREVSLWQQASRVAMLQREWADNMVSNTLYFDPQSEGRDVEQVLAEFAPLVKTMSMLPHTDEGAYAQMPYEGISADQYQSLKSRIGHLDWRSFTGSDGEDERFCANDTCAVPWTKGETGV